MVYPKFWLVASPEYLEERPKLNTVEDLHHHDIICLRRYNKLTAWSYQHRDSDTIETFLNARISDGDYFNWQAPDEASTSKYRALNRRKSIDYPGLATITVTFTEVFEP